MRCVYQCFYRGKQVGVTAESSYLAQVVAAKHFGLTAKNRNKVAVVLVEKNGEPVAVAPASL